MNTNKVENALACFEGGCNCCQSILLTYGSEFGLPNEVVLRLGTGFAGGMARCGEVCGAVTGAIMVIGLKHGMANENDDSATAPTDADERTEGKALYDSAKESLNGWEVAINRHMAELAALKKAEKHDAVRDLDLAS